MPIFLTKKLCLREHIECIMAILSPGVLSLCVLRNQVHLLGWAKGYGDKDLASALGSVISKYEL